MSTCRESNLPCVNVKRVSKALHAGLMAVLMAALMARCWWLYCTQVLFHTAARAHCRTIVLQNMKNFQWMKRPNDCVQNLHLRISQWFSFGGHLSGKHTEKSVRLSSKTGSIICPTVLEDNAGQWKSVHTQVPEVDVHARLFSQKKSVQKNC